MVKWIVSNKIKKMVKWIVSNKIKKMVKWIVSKKIKKMVKWIVSKRVLTNIQQQLLRFPTFQERKTEKNITNKMGKGLG